MATLKANSKTYILYLLTGNLTAIDPTWIGDMFTDDYTVKCKTQAEPLRKVSNYAIPMIQVCFTYDNGIAMVLLGCVADRIKNLTQKSIKLN